MTPYNCQLRVLVVSANPLRRVALLNKLRDRFGALCAAEGEGPALLEDARRLVQMERCHAAVVVHDLTDPFDPTADLDGLITQLAPAGIVICAVRPNDRLAFQAGRRSLEYVRFGDPASDLCAAVEARGRHGCKCDVAASWPETHFAASTAKRLKMPKDQVSDENLHDLLGRLFPQAETVDLQPLAALSTSKLVASAVRQSVVLLASERRPMVDTARIPTVIKIGPRDEIIRERENYARYVDGWLQQNRQARLEDSAELWHLGAISYAFLGVSPNDMAPFRVYYLQESAQNVLAALRQLFLETCHNWYSREREQVSGTRIFELYDEKLHLEQRMEQRLDMQNPFLRFPGLQEALPNPALWAYDVGRRAPGDSPTTAITHGDLHADNFFIDRNRQAWLIDFGQTGYSHALRDFVELEADLKLRLTDFGKEDLAGLASLEGALLAADQVDSLLLPVPAIAGQPLSLKAFQVIAGLRHLACQATGITNQREYLEALLYETLFMATLRRLHPGVRRRALLSAALIARALRANGGGPAGAPNLRLEVSSLAPLSPTETFHTIEQHRKYLQTCLDSVAIQGRVYAHPPAELGPLQRQIHEALIHTEQLRQGLA